MVAIAAVVVVLMTPYLGMISDRVGFGLGRRRSYMIIGTVVRSYPFSIPPRHITTARMRMQSRLHVV